MAALTRTSFAQACQKFIAVKNDDNAQNEFLARGSRGWKWVNYSTKLVHLGYLERTGYTSRQNQAQPNTPADEESSHVVEDEDESTAVQDLNSPELLRVQQHIAFSPTFQTPVFYFRIYSQDGAALPLSEIMQTTFFSGDVLPSDAQVTPHGISFHNSNFPVLSIGDHPVLNEPYWYLHPCQSSAAVDELMRAKPQRDDEDSLLSWLETWFLVLRSIVDIR